MSTFSAAIDHRLLTFSLIGLCGAIMLTVAGEIHPVLTLLVVALPACVLFPTQPKLLCLVTIAAFILFEEFPWGLGETAERSTRTAFYATSLGIPGLYPPDVLLFGAIILLIGRFLYLQRPLKLKPDRISIAIIILFFTVSISVLLSLLEVNPLTTGHAVQTGTVYKVNQKGAELIALFQIKNFSFLIIAYGLGLLYFESTADVERLKKVIFFCLVSLIVIGFLRLLIRPNIVFEMKPLFYHSPSSWIFALAIFYWIYEWSNRYLTHEQTVRNVILALFFLLFILISFRRTMWGATFIAGFALIPLLVHEAKRRYLVLLGGGIALLFALLLSSPGLLNAIVSRLMETSSEDASTIYRLSLFVWFRHNIDDIPLFGYGVKPLWDISASLGYFRTNLENIHSLYFWLILRFGLFGFAIFSLSLLFIFSAVYKAIKTAKRVHKSLCIVVFLGLFMFLFSGIFNPVYAEIRYIALTGFFLAFISRLSLIEGKSHA